MKKTLTFFAALLFCAALFSRPKKKQAKDGAAFNDINAIEFKASQPEAEYDVFTIGENTQSYTAERQGTPKKQTPGSNAFVPSVAGMIIAAEVIKDLTQFHVTDLFKE